MKLSAFSLFVAFTAAVASAAAAPPKAPEAGDHACALSVGGLERYYTLHAPRGHDVKKALPLVVMLHGGGGTGRAVAWETGWGDKADEAGFLVAYPEALARDPSRPGSFARNPQCWNDGSGRFEWGGAAVVCITVEGLGHTWAGGKSLLPERLVGRRSGRIRATDVIWAFFERHAPTGDAAVEGKPAPDEAAAAPRERTPPGSPPEWVTPAVRAPRLQHRTFESAAAKSKVSYHIYTPEEYDVQKERRFPVLYWLHGSGGGLPGLPQLVRHFDTGILSDKTPPMLVVFPNGLPHSLWCDSKDGNVPMETIMVKELVPHIDATFRTISTREGRVVEGFSMGGYGAARLGLKHHDLFGAVSLLGAGPLQREFTESPRVGLRGREAILQAVFGGDHEYFRALSPWVLAKQNASPVCAGTRVRQAIGERDETLGFNRQFHEHLARLGVPHTFTVVPGVGHNPMALLNALGEANWEFYRAVFGKRDSTAR